MAERAAVPHRADGRYRRAGADRDRAGAVPDRTDREGGRDHGAAELLSHRRRAGEIGDLGLDPGSEPGQSRSPAATGRQWRALDADAAARADAGARGAAAADRAAIPGSGRRTHARRHQGAAHRRHPAERQEHDQARHQCELGRNHRRRRSRPAADDAAGANPRLRDSGRSRRDLTEDRRRPRVSRHQISQRHLCRDRDLALPRIFCRQPDAAGQRLHPRTPCR